MFGNPETTPGGLALKFYASIRLDVRRIQSIKMGAEVIGISRDSVASHEKFQAHHSLNFLLLSDPGAAVHRLYGAWGKKMFGLAGVLRQTFIIDPEGRVRQVYPRVTPTHHGEQVIADLKRLQG